jgi:site-specific DNA-cytosine methylase
MDNSEKIILDLCGGTGSWSRPYKEAGFDVRVITLPDHDVLTYEPPDNVYGILAAPPCTEFSVLNCLAEARDRNEDEGLKVVFACLRIISKSNPKFWALENPRGFLRKHMLYPELSFQPWEYGDPWTKQTDIWGRFNSPHKPYKEWDAVPNKLPIYTRPGRGKPNLAFLHKSAWEQIPQFSYHKPSSDAEFRAMTPPGFARAFFEANH